MVITLHTKLVTRATQVKRKQACKTDYIVSPGCENPEKEKKGKQVSWGCGVWVGDPRARSGGNELSSGDATGGAVCSEESAGQEEAGSESDPASGSMTEWKTREGGYSSGRQEDFPAWARALGSFHQKPHIVFSHRNPQLSTHKQERNAGIPAPSFRQTAHLGPCRPHRRVGGGVGGACGP